MKKLFSFLFKKKETRVEYGRGNGNEIIILTHRPDGRVIRTIAEFVPARKEA